MLPGHRHPHQEAEAQQFRATPEMWGWHFLGCAEQGLPSGLWQLRA